VGHGQLHIQENDTGPDACNHAQFGMFLVSSPNLKTKGEYTGARLLDIAPTMLDLAGYQIPASMQGKSLASGKK
jgi:bisphosphoglycerate-independent phosphoglycerate mutase (AlkP superfamily)